jgi:tetratricopeptide (TPR) repeat protein
MRQHISSAISAWLWPVAAAILLTGSGARSLVQAAEADKALADCNEAVRSNPQDARAYVARARVYQKQAIPVDPQHAWRWAYREGSGDAKGPLGKAILDYTEAIRLDPGFAEAYKDRGYCYVQIGDYDRAIADYSAVIRLKSQWAEPYTNRARVYLCKHDLDKALADCNEAIRLDPQLVQAYNDRGDVFYDKNDYDRAIADFSEAIRLAPNNPRGYLNRSVVRLALFDPDKALADCMEVIRLDPEASDGYSYRASVYLKTRDYEKVISDSTEAIRLDATNSGGFNNRGVALYHEGNIDKALDDFTEAIRLHPGRAMVYTNRGVVYLGQGAYDKAIADFTEVIRLDGQSPDTYRYRGTAYRSLGQVDKADADLEQAAALQRQRATAGGRLVPAGSAASPAARLEIVLSSSRWQPLPSEVAAVYVGPDGRIWYQGPEYFPGGVAALQAAIEKEFTREAPQISGCAIVLFEPGRRVWFHLRELGLLLGYDGKQWVQHAIADREDEIVGRCLTRGGLIEGAANRFAGGAAWFIGGRGVYRFDGQNWSYQRIEGQRQWPDDIYLAVSADGRTAAANHCGSGIFWVNQAGQWKRFDWSGAGAPGSSDGPTPPLGPVAASPPPGRRGLVIGPGPSIWVNMLEGRFRRFSPDGREQTAAPGGLTLEKVSDLYQDESGRVFLLAEGIGQGDGPRTPGLVIFTPDGRTTILAGGQFTRGWRPHFVCDLPGVLTASGKQVWLPFRDLGEPSRLLDLEKKEFVDGLPDDRCTLIQAVSGDGRVFASRYLSARNIAGGPIMVYTPGAPFAHPPLKVEHWLGTDLHLAVGDDGTVWAEHQGDGLMRFDGRQWQRAEPKPPGNGPPTGRPARNFGRRVLALLPGHGGTMLVCSDQEAALYQGAAELASGDTSTLIEENADKLRQAFAPKPLAGTKPDHERAAELTADAAGNLWWRQGWRVLVWTGHDWLNAHEPLVAAGSRTGQVRWMCPAGDGSKVYVSDGLAPIRQDRGFLGSVRAGRLEFTPAPHCEANAECDLDCLRDRDGAVWVPSDNPEPQGWSRPLAVRLDQSGEPKRIAVPAWPRLADAAGNVWLGALHYGPYPQDTLWVVRHGEVVQQLRLPGRTFRDLMFSDRPGSVYVWTVVGLTHLTAEAPEYRDYRQAAVYPVPDVRGTIRAVAYAPHGYMAAVAFTDLPKREYHVYLVELPKE